MYGGIIAESGMDASRRVDSDPSADSNATHIPVSKITIGSWNLVAKYDEHVLLSFYWAERKLVWEVLYMGVVRKMESDFDDIADIRRDPTTPTEEQEKLLFDLQRPPRFYREAPGGGDGQKANYIYTTDFTNGQASQCSRHVICFPLGALTAHAGAIKKAGLQLHLDGAGGAGATAAGGPTAANLHLAAARLRKPPTSSPRLDAIILQEQLEREMRECQARYTGICPVRERMYAAAFDELIVAVGRDEAKRGTLLRRVRDEARMSIDGFRTVFETSLIFGGAKLSQAVAIKGDLEEQIAALEAEIGELQAEAKQLDELCESLEHRCEQKAKAYEVKDKEIVDLTTEKQQLEDLLVVLRASKPDKSQK